MKARTMILVCFVCWVGAGCHSDSSPSPSPALSTKEAGTLIIAAPEVSGLVREDPYSLEFELDAQPELGKTRTLSIRLSPRVEGEMRVRLSLVAHPSLVVLPVTTAEQTLQRRETRAWQAEVTFEARGPSAINVKVELLGSKQPAARIHRVYFYVPESALTLTKRGVDASAIDRFSAHPTAAHKPMPLPDAARR